MAITDYKITDGEITQRNVKSAPDVLSDTPNNNKAVFDNLTEHFIGKYNDLIDNINSDFVDSSEFAEGLTVTDKVRWRYALTKGTSIGLNFSGNITQITTGFRTIVGDIDNLTETDFMDCYLSINGTDYECGDSYTSGNSILTSAIINGVTVEIIYDTANGNITLEHATNPLDTLYWNVSIYRSVAEKVPAKCLPADLTSAGYAEVKADISDLSDGIDTINDTLGASIVVKSDRVAVGNMSAGTRVEKTFTSTVIPSGYKALCAVITHIGTTSQTTTYLHNIVSIGCLMSADGSGTVIVSNVGSGTQNSVSVIINIICVKDELTE